MAFTNVFGPEYPSRLESRGGEVLVMSMRQAAKLVGYSQPYEFEDVITEVCSADRIDVGNMSALKRARRGFRMLRGAGLSTASALKFAPQPPPVSLTRDYDLFFPIFNDASELFALSAVPDWRKRCRYAVCLINELWLPLPPQYVLDLLSQFDQVLIGFKHCVAELESAIRRPSAYLPMAVDVERFAPLPERIDERPIDVCYIGRRSSVTHEALLQMASRRDSFYYYDTIAAGADRKQRTFQVESGSEHRRLLASLLKRSGFFFANRARVNEPEFTHNRQELSSRFYEGAASGTVMVGEPANSDEFKQQFDWPDAVIPVPFNSPDIANILGDLAAQPVRIQELRRANVRNAALRHDWVHRVQHIFEKFGLQPTEKMLARQQRLKDLAARV